MGLFSSEKKHYYGFELFLRYINRLPLSINSTFLKIEWQRGDKKGAVPRALVKSQECVWEVAIKIIVGFEVKHNNSFEKKNLTIKLIQEVDGKRGSNRLSTAELPLHSLVDTNVDAPVEIVEDDFILPLSILTSSSDLHLSVRSYPLQSKSDTFGGKPFWGSRKKSDSIVGDGSLFSMQAPLPSPRQSLSGISHLQSSTSSIPLAYSSSSSHLTVPPSLSIQRISGSPGTVTGSDSNSQNSSVTGSPQRRSFSSVGPESVSQASVRAIPSFKEKLSELEIDNGIRGVNGTSDDVSGIVVTPRTSQRSAFTMTSTPRTFRAGSQADMLNPVHFSVLTPEQSHKPLSIGDGATGPSLDPNGPPDPTSTTTDLPQSNSHARHPSTDSTVLFQDTVASSSGISTRSHSRNRLASVDMSKAINKAVGSSNMEEEMKEKMNALQQFWSQDDVSEAEAVPVTLVRGRADFSDTEGDMSEMVDDDYPSSTRQQSLSFSLTRARSGTDNDLDNEHGLGGADTSQWMVDHNIKGLEMKQNSQSAAPSASQSVCQSVNQPVSQSVSPSHPEGFSREKYWRERYLTCDEERVLLMEALQLEKNRVILLQAKISDLESKLSK